jgi:hypothetical protein
MSNRSGQVAMEHNGRRINEISNYKQMLVGVVMSSKFYENVDRNIK